MMAQRPTVPSDTEYRPLKQIKMSQSFHPETNQNRPKVPWRPQSLHNKIQTRRPLFTSAELHALKTGMHCTMYQSMGAHPDEVNGIKGTRFAVWAPNAQEVCVICDRNHWKHGENYPRLYTCQHDGWRSLFWRTPYRQLLAGFLVSTARPSTGTRSTGAYQLQALFDKFDKPGQNNRYHF